MRGYPHAVAAPYPDLPLTAQPAELHADHAGHLKRHKRAIQPVVRQSPHEQVVEPSRPVAYLLGERMNPGIYAVRAHPAGKLHCRHQAVQYRAIVGVDEHEARRPRLLLAIPAAGDIGGPQIVEHLRPSPQNAASRRREHPFVRAAGVVVASKLIDPHRDLAVHMRAVHTLKSRLWSARHRRFCALASACRWERGCRRRTARAWGGDR